MSQVEAPDERTNASSELQPPHGLTEVATEVQLMGRNGRLLVQLGSRYVVRC